MAFVKHRFGSTFYVKFKSNSKVKKTPIIFLHGGPGSTHNYFLNLKSLAKDREIYMYDQIGGGQSSDTGIKHWTIDTFVEELKTLVKAWKLDNYILMGASWGTTLALEYFLAANKNEKKRIEKIIFQSPLFSTSDWEKDANRLIKELPKKSRKIINYCHEIEATDSKVYQKTVLEYYLKHVLRNKKLLFAPRKPNINGDKIYAHMWGPSEFKATGTLKKYERASQLKKLKLPVLLVCGQYDEATPETVKKYHKMIKGSQFKVIKVIKEASHCISLERPKDLIKVIKTFID
ncbi:MAG: proline iminopeptidase-family hydrolase [Bacteriovorax sp.]|nr:proline iminopeptidase-family hydrolase [Bacteriovorax sp.]